MLHASINLASRIGTFGAWSIDYDPLDGGGINLRGQVYTENHQWKKLIKWWAPPIYDRILLKYDPKISRNSSFTVVS